MVKKMVAKPDTYLAYLNCRLKHPANAVDTLQFK
jgi:hypothetical protein